MAYGQKILKGDAYKRAAIKRRHIRIRKNLSGTAERPRLVVTRSNRHIVAQVIDDIKGHTLAQSLDLGLAGAQLVELALAGRIAPDGDRIAVVAPRPTGDPTLDCALELLRRRGAPVRAVNWS